MDEIVFTCPIKKQQRDKGENVDNWHAGKIHHAK
jgi:hypothetical protein